MKSGMHLQRPAFYFLKTQIRVLEAVPPEQRQLFFQGVLQPPLKARSSDFTVVLFGENVLDQ